MKKGLYSTGATKLKNIFLAPMEAVIQADIDLAKRVSDFIMSYGFSNWKKQDENSEPYYHLEQKVPELKMVTFSYENNDNKTVIISIPVLSLIQLPLLQIKEAHFDMKVKMITVDVGTENQMPQLLSSQSNATQPSVSNIKAFLTPSTSSNMEAMKSNMKVRLNMDNSDMPGGIIQLLAMMGELNHIKIENNE